MKYNIGYNLTGGNPFSDLVSEFKDCIDEVYFPWIGFATGRETVSEKNGYTDWNVLDYLRYDLQRIKAMGIKLNILFNGNCYGSEALSISLQNKIYSVIDYLDSINAPVDSVTTSSPAIAHMVKLQYAKIDVRASVNMSIGTKKGIDYVENLFDSFYIAREINRDLTKIKELSDYARKKQKKLYMLANSGCMTNCSYHVFHDNTVAHQSEILKMQNIKKFPPFMCHDFISKAENRVCVLQNTWVRPEDIHNYEPYFDSVKLATRTHQLPSLVISAYAKEKYFGNLLDLFEPSYSMDFAPFVIDNSLFPGDWFNVTSACSRDCENCGYCKNVLKRVLVRAE